MGEGVSEIWATIPDWHEKQHYKKERGAPPWIKLHTNILNSRKFQRLPLASKALAPQLWLLATKNDGRVNIEMDELEFQLRWPRQEIEEGLKSLIENEYLIVASDALADCYQTSVPETEAETYREEAEAETEKNIGAVAPEIVPRETPRQILETVLSREKADAVIKHRKALRKPLTDDAAKLLIKALSKCRDGPERGVEMMIERAWLTYKPEWDRDNDQRNRNDANGKPQFSGVVANLREMLDHPEDHDPGGGESLPHPVLISGGR